MAVYLLVETLIKGFISLLSAYYSQEDMRDVLITDQYPDREKEGEQRPRIVVKRGSMTLQAGSMHTDIASEDLFTGEGSRLMPVSCDIVLMCLSRVGVEAERIAAEVADMLWAEQNQICAGMPVQSIGSVTIGGEEMLEVQGDVTEWVNVPLGIGMLARLEQHYGPQGELLLGVDYSRRTSE